MSSRRASQLSRLLLSMRETRLFANDWEGGRGVRCAQVTVDLWWPLFVGDT